MNSEGDRGRNTFRAMNESLNKFGFKLTKSEANPEEWSVGDGKRFLKRYEDGMVIPAPKPPGPGRGLALMQRDEPRRQAPFGGRGAPFGGRGRGRGRRGWGRFEGRRHRRGRTRRVRRTRPRWRDRRGGQRGRRARGFRDADQTRALRFLESLLDPHRKIDGRACGRGKGRGRGKRTDATASVRAPSERRRFRGGASDGSTGLVAETRRTGAVILQRLVLLLQLAQQPGVDLDRGRVGRHRAPSSETRGAHFKRLFSGVDEATKENGHFDHQQFLFFRCRRCALRTTRRS